MNGERDMTKKAYSAGVVKLSFWFSEFKKTVHLMNSGKTLDEIKELNVKENIYSASTAERSLQIFNTVSARIRALDPSFLRIFEELDISNQKIVALIAVMESDSLFFDFMFEVYREKIIMGVDEITDSDVSIFFKDKQMQDERAAKWKDYTLKRLGLVYRTILAESGVIDRTTGVRKILKPILDESLELVLIDRKMHATLKALTGVR